jgi:hypothetical protein
MARRWSLLRRRDGRHRHRQENSNCLHDRSR